MNSSLNLMKALGSAHYVALTNLESMLLCFIKINREI